ncbi:MAG TPA: NAD-dependent epimerase/dehydratase family protein [Baekduia sp.]|jgi:nucleoside-diphosphate-sugar epimerase
MTRSLLVLGGSSFVGRALVEEGLARGWAVTTFNRGRGGWSDPRAQRLIGDRLGPATLAPLGARDWDLVADTWAGAPRAARDSAVVLAGHVGHYAYISSCSVYAPPPPFGLDEETATVDASPEAEETGYAADKRGAELAIAQAFGDRALLARPGLILGPHEDVGRLPWWLARLAAGGEVLAPGPADLPLQYIDARDLARFTLDGAAAGLAGPFNAVSRRGHATMASVLEACRATAGAPDAHLTWVAPETIAAAGIEPWTELPIWLPPDHEYAAMHGANVERAHAAGLRCRPIAETVADTWAWLQALDGAPPLRTDLDPPGVGHDRELAALRAWHDRAGC